MGKYIPAATWGLFSLTLLFWFGIIYRLVRFPENHVGWNILNGMPLFGFLLVLLLMTNRLGSSRVKWIGLLYSLISIIFIGLAYYFNVLLPYEVWLQRGMPPRPF